MHGCMSRKTFQSSRHIDQFLNLFIFLIQFLEFRIHLQCLIKRNIQLCRHHLCNAVYKCIRKVHDTSYVTDDSTCCHRTESYDLYYPGCAVFSSYIINDFLASLKAEVHVDIGHGYTFRIQETLEQKLIFDRVDTCNSQTVRYDTSGRRTSPRSDLDSLCSCIINEIPHDQEVIYISHGFDDRQFIFQTFFQRIIPVRIPFFQSVKTKFIQIFPGSISFRHIIFRQFGDTEFNLYITAVCNLLRVLQRLQCIWK